MAKTATRHASATQPPADIPGSPAPAEVRLRGQAMPVGQNLVLVRTGEPRPQAQPPAGELARVLVPKLGRALRRPGIPRESVFSGPNAAQVVAYSIDPADPSRLVRETADGTREVGCLDADGEFQVLHALTPAA